MHARPLPATGGIQKQTLGLGGNSNICGSSSGSETKEGNGSDEVTELNASFSSIPAPSPPLHSFFIHSASALIHRLVVALTYPYIHTLASALIHRLAVASTHPYIHTLAQESKSIPVSTDSLDKVCESAWSQEPPQAILP